MENTRMGQEKEHVNWSSDRYSRALSSNQNHTLLIKVGSNLTLEGGKKSKSERFRLGLTLCFWCRTVHPDFVIVGSWRGALSTSKAEKPRFQTKHMQKSRVTHKVFITNK